MERICARRLGWIAACACVLAVVGCKSEDEGNGTAPTTMAGSGGGAGSGSPPPVPGVHTTPGTSMSTGGSGGSGSGMAGTGTGSGTGAPSDALSSLGPEDATEICQQLNDAFDAEFSTADAERLICTLFAVVLTAVPDASGNVTLDRPACEQQVDECLTSGGATTTETRCDAAGLTAAAADCPLTIGQYTECRQAQVAALAGLLDTVRCDAEPNDALLTSAALGADPASLPECAAFLSMCPELVTRSSPMAPSEPPSASGCDETCVFPKDGECDDGGPGSIDSLCGLGTDCTDCGPR